MDRVKVAVIGYGHLGKWHCEKVETTGQAKLCYIVEPNKDNAKIAQSKFPSVKVVSSLDECIDDIDAGIVVTPTVFHAGIVENLLKHKKHIFCEKPITARFSEYVQLESTMDDNLILQVGHSERFHQLWEKRELYSPFLKSGHIEINRYAPFKGRATDVDVVQDLMIHDIDLLYFITGEYPIKVKSRGFKIRTDKWDSVNSFFQFPSGASAVINVGRNHCQERRDVILSNTTGVCSIDLMQEKIFIATADKESVEEFSFERRDHLQIEHNHFYTAILEKSEPVVSFAAGAKAVSIVEGVLQSIEQWPNTCEL